MKVLFVCNQNQNRSKTADELFNYKYDTKSAGLFNLKPISKNEISWADVVIVMEDFQRSEIAKRSKLPRSTISLAFSRRGNPTLKTIAKIVHEAVTHRK